MGGSCVCVCVFVGEVVFRQWARTANASVRAHSLAIALYCLHIIMVYFTLSHMSLS